MVVLDAETGEIKALVGGRNYGVSQLNHALAQRPRARLSSPSSIPRPWRRVSN